MNWGPAFAIAVLINEIRKSCTHECRSLGGQSLLKIVCSVCHHFASLACLVAQSLFGMFLGWLMLATLRLPQEAVPRFSQVMSDMGDFAIGSCLLYTRLGVIEASPGRPAAGHVEPAATHHLEFLSASKW